MTLRFLYFWTCTLVFFILFYFWRAVESRVCSVTHCLIRRSFFKVVHSAIIRHAILHRWQFCPFTPPRTLLNITSSQLLIIGPVPVFRRPSEVSDGSSVVTKSSCGIARRFPYRLPGEWLLSSKAINRFDSRQESDRLFRVPDCQ